MDEQEDDIKRTFKQRRESDRMETDRAFAEIVENERKARLAKTMRLRSMRVVKNA